MEVILGITLFVAWVISIILIFFIYGKVTAIEAHLSELDHKIEVGIAVSGYIVQPDMLSTEFHQQINLIAQNSGKADALTAIGEMLGVDRSKAEDILHHIRP